MAGFHHIINRGAARDNVYRCDEDKEKYLEILCKACKIYKVNIHDYCLMDNRYHLLLVTVLNSDQEVIPCAEHSQIKREIEYEGIREHLEMALTKQELKELEIRQI